MHNDHKNGDNSDVLLKLILYLKFFMKIDPIKRISF